MYIPELLSPVGDFECLKAAVQNGANAVYLGASSFSARAKATNFDNDELEKAISYAKLRNVKVNLALNTLIKDSEFEDAVSLAVRAHNAGVDAIIIQDIGLAKYLIKNYPDIVLHGSTQMTVHNLDGVKQLEKIGFKRVVLSRELSINEIKHIKENTSIELEVFVHGALCISYSGQCLLSSMIGGRSGNRGDCAQPCRLSYELIEKSDSIENSLDKGYLLSPRDNFGIEFLPELIKMGITSFKIEGRMKTPTYVATVTKIYRKYIDFVLKNISLENDKLKELINKNLDVINENTMLSDRKEITQVFNRGGFSTGHFKPSPNKELIFKDKPNNMGIYVGTISHVNENKGHLKLKLEDSLSIGDKVSINNNSYTVSELMIGNKNFETLDKGNIVTIGRMKGNIKVSNKIYKIESAKLNKVVIPSFKEDKNLKKVILNANISIKENTPIFLHITSSDGFYNKLSYDYVSDIIPSPAQNRPISAEKIIEQFSKTGNTEFEFENINVDLDDNLFIPMGVLNEIRRTVLENIEDLILEKYKQNLEIKEVLFPIVSNGTDYSDKSISLLLNTIDLDFDYSNLYGFDKLYIPLNFFVKQNYKNLIKELSNLFNTYIYMPHVIKDEKIHCYNFDKILEEFNIKGFIISHISQFETLNKYSNYEFIGNYNLNLFNSFSTTELNKFNLSSISLSPELNSDEINDIIEKTNSNTEIIVYGNLPVMTNSYCYLGKSNKCYSDCKHKCNLKSKFYLKDRLNCNFRIVPDNIQTLTTIYNTKTLSVKYENLKTTSIRIDILDENPKDIQSIINTVASGERFEGKSYTNGKL